MPNNDAVLRSRLLAVCNAAGVLWEPSEDLILVVRRLLAAAPNPFVSFLSQFSLAYDNAGAGRFYDMADALEYFDWQVDVIGAVILGERSEADVWQP